MPQKKTKVIREIPENPFIQGQAKRKKLRVAAYCRVSTEQEEQESSFENQVAYYTDLIQSNPEWEFAGIFADRGISGTKDTIRPEFMKMIEHCQRHKIDLIFTKSLSRFSRNTLDSIKYIRLLKSLNVTIEFEKEGLNTSDVSSEIYLTWFSAFAQAESESISQNVTMGKRRQYKEGHFAFRYKNFLGYRPGENGEPEIDPEQATIVSRIFFAFLSGDTPEQIAKSLEAGEVKQYYITDNHPAIIPRDIFQEVQLEIARRSSKRKVSCRRTKSGRGKYTSKYALSERTVCGECGAMYRRTMWIKRDRTKEDVWRCVNRLEFGTKYCKHSPSLKEPILHQAILNCIQSVFHNKEEIAEAVREAQKKIILFEDAKNNPEVIRQRMQDIDHGMANLLTLAAQSSQIELFEKKFKEMTEEKARLTEQLKQAEEDATTDAKRQKQLDDILKAIDIDIVELTEFDDTFIRRIVEQVTILSKDKIEVRFIGGFSKVGDIPTK
uniref:recombinase family protein n=1 Tax=Candidatus Fimivicinus sp. TaxID=3056640 RepID=UPI00402571D2